MSRTLILVLVLSAAVLAAALTLVGWLILRGYEPRFPGPTYAECRQQAEHACGAYEEPVVFFDWTEQRCSYSCLSVPPASGSAQL